MENFNSLVNDLKLPDQLKDYLTSSKEIRKYLTPINLNEIEELYIYYNFLYNLDSIVFSEYTIRTLKNSNTIDSIQLQLQSIIEENNSLKSHSTKAFKSKKSKVAEESLAKKVFLNIALEFIDFSQKNYNNPNIDVKEFYKYVGKLEVINELIDNNFYRKLLHDTKFMIHIYDKL